MIELGLNVGAALSALVAAIFWFASAAGKTPKPDTTYRGFFEVPGAIIAALNYSAKRNRIAALFSANLCGSYGGRHSVAGYALGFQTETPPKMTPAGSKPARVRAVRRSRA